MPAKKASKTAALKSVTRGYVLLSAALFGLLIYLGSTFTIQYADFQLAFSRFGVLFGLMLLFSLEVIFRGPVQGALGLRIAPILFALFAPLIIANSIPSYLALSLFFLAEGFMLGVLKEISGLRASVLAMATYALLFFATTQFMYTPSVALSLILLLMPFYYYLSLGKNIGETLEQLGLARKYVFTNVFFGLGWAGVVLSSVAAISIVMRLAGVSDQQLVVDKISTLPTLMLVFAAFFAPIAEEVFFRGFLLRKMGPWASSALFAVAHFAYGSSFEIISTFIIALLFCATVRVHRSLVPAVVAHLFVNALSITVVRLVS